MKHLRHFLFAIGIACAAPACAQNIASLPEAIAFANDLEQRQGFAAEQLLARVDQALYQANDAGKNRVHHAD